MAGATLSEGCVVGYTVIRETDHQPADIAQYWISVQSGVQWTLGQCLRGRCASTIDLAYLYRLYRCRTYLLAVLIRRERPKETPDDRYQGTH